MTIKMNDSHIHNITQLKRLGKVRGLLEFKAQNKKEMYGWVDEKLSQFNYFNLSKKNKGTVRGFLKQMTGLSTSQISRLVRKKKESGKVWLGQTNRHSFLVKYRPKEIALLAETDNAHNRLSGPATKRILEREYNIFNKKEYGIIKGISSSHIYNLREKRVYKTHCLTVKNTRSIKAPNIGERRRPEPEGEPGFLRVDTVHQGDLDNKKGVYHINAVDITTQWEVVGATEKISERYLVPIIQGMLNQFPFTIQGFHSDNGSEFINKVVARLLEKLRVEFTKSRARHCNDNALVEGKNGSVVRKAMGHNYIPQKWAPAINGFYDNYLNTYLNYHRPCGFPTIVTDKRGKRKKAYDTYLTPYEKLRSLKNAGVYLKKGISFEKLDRIAYEFSDNESAKRMQKAKQELFKNLKNMPQGRMVYTTFVNEVSCSFVD